MAQWTRRRFLGTLAAGAAGVLGAGGVAAWRRTTAGAQADLAPTATVNPYVDAEQLNVPWPDHSFLRQPWRGYLQTVPAHGFFSGDLRVGLNYNVPATAKGPSDADVCANLMAMGVRTVRLEIPWDSVDWNETSLRVPPGRLAAFASTGIRPLVLLNANHGGPCPSVGWNAQVRAAAPKGARTIYLDSLAQAVPGYTGLSNLTGYWMAEVLFTSVDVATGRCDLSRPLPAALRSGQRVRVDRLKYRPFGEVGSPEWNATLAGWLRYVDLVGTAVQAAGLPVWDVEIWNELTFGSNFLDINLYYQPPLYKTKYGFPGLEAGEPGWELGRATVDHVRQTHPGVGTIWGFSNTTFFHTPIAKLPPFTAAQSYHPYGTKIEFPKQAEHTPNVDGYTPTYIAQVAEGVAATFIQTESVIRLIQPSARPAHPPEVASGAFRQYFTEHGFTAKDMGAKTVAEAWRARSKFMLRNLLFWCNKGLSGIWFYAADDHNPLGMGFLDASAPDTPTPPLLAWQDVLRTFGATSALTASGERRSLVLDQLTAQGVRQWVFEGDGVHPGLAYDEVLAFLPYQTAPARFVVAVYVMTQDFPADMAPQVYQLQVSGLAPGGTLGVSCRDPLQQGDVAVSLLSHDSSAGRAVIQMPVVDYPRLLTLDTSAT